MSRRKDNYENSRWLRFKRWVDGETDILADGMAARMEKQTEQARLKTVGEKTPSPINTESKSDERAERAPSNVQVASGVRRKSGVQRDACVHGESNIQCDSGVRGESGVQRDACVQGESDIQCDSGVRGESGVQRDACVQGESGVRCNSGVRDESDVQGNAGLLIEADSYERLRRREERDLRWFHRVYQVMSVILCVGIIFILLWTIAYLPVFGNAGNPDNNEVSARYIEKGLEETGATNIVTGMILDYRAFDTFGESCVLFIASCCVLALLRIDAASGDEKTRVRLEEANDRLFEPKNDVILQKCACVLVPVILIFGIYIIVNGHLSPGGGFSGGAVLGSGLILYLNAFGFQKMERFFTERTYRTITVCSLTFYCLAKSYSFFTGANHLESGISPGTPGAITSGGLILPLNICVGLVVACTMYAFYALFRKGGM